MQTQMANPHYGNWVPKRIIGYAIGAFLTFGLLSAWVSLTTLVRPNLRLPLSLPLMLLTVIGGISVFYFIYTRHLLAYDGQGIQEKVLNILLEQVNWNGNGPVLDIGCGSGALTIKVARKFDQAIVTGIDYWGGMWEYSKKLCEENAKVEGVGDRCRFLQASASSLPFQDDSFDLVVSNLVFHEVKDGRSKLDAIQEALRVLKKGGCFAFQDLFLIRQYFGDPDGLLKTVESWGVRKVHIMITARSPLIPRALAPPFMLGALAIIHGEK